MIKGNNSQPGQKTTATFSMGCEGLNIGDLNANFRNFFGPNSSQGRDHFEAYSQHNKHKDKQNNCKSCLKGSS